MRHELQASVGGLGDKQGVPELEPELGQQLLWKDHAGRIPDFLDLDLHGLLRVLYALYNIVIRFVQPTGQDVLASIASSSAIRFSITLRPIDQNCGSVASRPNGLSSSLWCLVPPAASMSRYRSAKPWSAFS